MTEIKKNHSLQRIRLMKQAAVIRQSNGMSRHDALVTAHRIGKLIRQMHHGNVCFRYTKQDGTIRGYMHKHTHSTGRGFNIGMRTRRLRFSTTAMRRSAKKIR